jgi:hypothetical protein
MWEQQNHGENTKGSGYHGLVGREGCLGRAQRMFSSVKLGDSIMVYTGHYTFSKPIDCIAPRVTLVQPIDPE